ncbi:MAG: AAA family ATPase [Asgard group archaeon]|nr:AAA family ATPase [Asgard group archaeon]
MVVITISGPHGAGKSTYAKAIADHFSLRYISSGKTFRKLAEKAQLNLEAFSKKCENDFSIDREIDAITKDEAAKGDVVLEGQLASWMAKDYADFNIYVTASLEIRVKRISGRDERSFEEALEETKYRRDSEINRFKIIYGVDLEDQSIYDLILNTERLSKEVCLEILLAACETFIEHEKPHSSH